jgi:hypothetical protein
MTEAILGLGWQPHSMLWIDAILFFVAAILLDLADISMPRGDAVNVTGALCAAALLILGPLQAVAVCMTSAVVAHILRRGIRMPRRILVTLLARGVGFLVASGLYFGVGVDGPSWRRYFVVAVIPAAFILGELLAAQTAASVGTGRPLGRLLRGNLAGQAPLLIAQWSASLLLLITYNSQMGPWSLVPVMALLLLMRQSYALVLSTRETYRTTVEVLVEAAESEDGRRVGHADRTAVIARTIAARLGMAVSAVERISYVALLHDVDALGQHLETSEPAAAEFEPGHSSSMFEGVEFFSDVLPVLRLCDGSVAEDAEVSDDDVTAAMVVALSSDVDCANHPDVAKAHGHAAIDRVLRRVSPATRAEIVGAALSLGYKTPAVH